MTARVRLLLPWVGADDVGGGYIRRSAIADEPDVRRIEVLFGSDPAKAPRGINHWGAAIEAFDGSTSAMLGFMKSQKTGSASDAEAEIRRQKESGEHPFDAIFNTASSYSAITRKVTLRSDTDLNIHNMARAQQLAVAQLERNAGVKELRGTALKCTSGKGFLQTIDDLMKAGLKKTASLHSLCYTHNARNYTATLKTAKPVGTRTIAFQRKKGQKVSKTYTDLMDMEFEVLNQVSGERTQFALLVGTAGNLEGVPVQIVHQPNWWFKVILNLDTVERSNP